MAGNTQIFIVLYLLCGLLYVFACDNSGGGCTTNSDCCPYETCNTGLQVPICVAQISQAGQLCNVGSDPAPVCAQGVGLTCIIPPWPVNNRTNQSYCETTSLTYCGPLYNAVCEGENVQCINNYCVSTIAQYNQTCVLNGTPSCYINQTLQFKQTCQFTSTKGWVCGGTRLLLQTCGSTYLGWCKQTYVCRDSNNQVTNVNGICRAA